jgi:hypothetical protein
MEEGAATLSDGAWRCGVCGCGGGCAEQQAPSQGRKMTIEEMKASRWPSSVEEDRGRRRRRAGMKKGAE